MNSFAATQNAERVVGYARYSTDRQTENSIAYQTEAINKYCEANGIAICHFYVDEAQSGTNTSRAGFQELVRDAEAGLIDKVIIYDLSRGSRDVVDWFSFRKTMMNLGVKVVSVTQQLGDLTNPTEFFQELITVGIGQFEVLQTRQKSIAGTTAKAKQGVFLGGVPPLGYDVMDGEYVINEKESEWVRIIFAMYADGKTYKDILKKLRSLGAVGKRGRPLGKNSLYSILTNERYIGTYTWNRRRVKQLGKWAGGGPNPNIVRIEDAIPKIIDMETWRRTQKRLKDNKHKGRNRAKKREYLLTGLIECGNCGSTYYGKTNTNKGGYESVYYVCSTKHNKGTAVCSAKNINAAELETFVIQNLKHYLRSADFAAVAQQVASQLNNASPDLQMEKTELAEIETKLQNGVKAILSGLDIPELKEEMDRLRVRKSELEDVIHHAKSSQQKVKPERILELIEESIAAFDSGDKSAVQRALKFLVTKIYAHADGSCTVNVGVSVIGCGGQQHATLTTFAYRVA